MTRAEAVAHRPDDFDVDLILILGPSTDVRLRLAFVALKKWTSENGWLYPTDSRQRYRGYGVGEAGKGSPPF